MLNGRGSFGGNVFKIQLIYMKQIGRCCPGPSYALLLMILSACLMKTV